MDIETEELLESIVQGIRKIKGKEIVSLDLSKIDNGVCDFFIICHGDSNRQVGAIADEIEKVVKQNLKQNVWHKEGMENCQWVLLDFDSIVVHVFQKEYRDFYNLEGLWADAEIVIIDEEL